MPYCPRCGVEVDQIEKTCPLCETDIPVLDSVKNSGRRLYPSENLPSEHYHMTDQTRLRYQMVITFIMLIPILMVLSTDYMITGRISWSRYVLTSLITLWLLIIVPFMKTGIGRKWYLSYALIIAAMLVVFDSFDKQVTWSLYLSGPLVLSTCFIMIMAGKAMAKAPRKGFNIIAYTFTGLIAECLATDIYISLYSGNSWIPGWSLIVAAALLPVTLLMFYLHHIMKKEFTLKRFFHL